MSVFLRKKHLSKGDYLVLIESYYDQKTKNSKQKTLKKIGYIDDLKKKYTNPEEYFKEEARRLSKVSQNKYKESKEEKIPREDKVRNLGYFCIKRLYEKFNMDNEFKFLTLNRKFKINTGDVFKFLTYSQIVNPGSKASEYSNKSQFFEKFDFSDDQMYDVIKLIGENDKKIQEHIRFELGKFYTPNTKTSYFDGTNIYFEIDQENEEIRRGPEKNNRHDPIIGIGLLIDGNGIPLSYTTFPGNESEKPELHKNLQELKKKENIKGKTIIVADKGLNSGDNIIETIEKGDGYVFSQKVRGASQETQEWILDEKEYEQTINEDNVLIYKIKSETDMYEINVTSKLNGQKVKRKVKQKRIIFYSKEYADKEEFERAKMVAKAKELINNPSSYKKATVGNIGTYIKEIKYDRNGEIILNKSILEIDQDRINEERKLDGYYMIVTSETKLSNDEIISIYRGLWEIEESFSIIKGVLRIRPVFAKTLKGVHAQVLICFFSLLLLRLLQKKILKPKVLSIEQKQIIEKANKRKRVHKITIPEEKELPIKQIVGFIREFTAIELDDSYFISKYNENLPRFEKVYDLFLDKHRMSIYDIKKIFQF